MIVPLIGSVLVIISLLYCLITLNWKKYYKSVIVIFLLLSGLSGFISYLVINKYDITFFQFNYISLIIFLVTSIDVFLMLSMFLYDKIKQKNETQKNETQKNEKKHAVLICAHNSSQNIIEAIKTLSKFVNISDIFIADNGSSSEEQRLTNDVCVILGANYINIKEGNKSMAQLIGSYKLYNKGYTHITICDDDLIFESFGIDKILKIFDEEDSIKCVSHMVLPLKIKDNIINKFQRIEYALSFYVKYVQSKISTCFFSSGAISTWDIEIIIEILLRHNGAFKGDDMRCGMILHSLNGSKFLSQMKIHESSYKIKMNDDLIYTKVPVCRIHSDKCKCGEPSLFKQRVVSWENSRYSFFFKYLANIFTSNCWSVRLSYIFCVLTIFIDLFIVCVMFLSVYSFVTDFLYTLSIIIQMTFSSSIILTTCWMIIRKIDNVKLKWVLLMPLFYYLPNIFLVKIPSVFFSLYSAFTDKKENICFYNKSIKFLEYIKH